MWTEVFKSRKSHMMRTRRHGHFSSSQTVTQKKRLHLRARLVMMLILLATSPLLLINTVNEYVIQNDVWV